MSDTEAPKVVSLRSRQPYETPIAAPVLPLNPIDSGSVMCLKDLIERFESGELSGCVVMAWIKEERRFENVICVPANEELDVAALRYVGGVELLKEDLLNMHLYGDVEWEDPEDIGA